MEHLSREKCNRGADKTYFDRLEGYKRLESWKTNVLFIRGTNAAEQEEDKMLRT